MSISARNKLKGTITGIVIGDVMAEVTIEVGQSVIDAIITRRSAEELGLKKGDSVVAVIKATEVMVSKD
jgi:molybdopterin-binding protein